MASGVKCYGGNKRLSKSQGRKKEEEGKFNCPICDEAILDASDGKLGDDSIHCDSVCSTWIHQQCTGLSKLAFTTIKVFCPFKCPHCHLSGLTDEVKSLKEFISDLLKHLSLVSDELADLKQRTKDCATPVQPDGNPISSAQITPQDTNKSTILLPAISSLSSKNDNRKILLSLVYLRAGKERGDSYRFMRILRKQMGFCLTLTQHYQIPVSGIATDSRMALHIPYSSSFTTQLMSVPF